MAMKTAYYAAVLIFALSDIAYSYNCTRSGSNTVCRLEAIEDVFLEDSGNKNYHTILIVGYHPGYPIKRSLLTFEEIPSAQCAEVQRAEMYVYYWYGHKASFQTEQEAPYIPRPLEVRQVLKNWSETEATRFNRLRNIPWSTPYLGLDGTDASSNAEDVQIVNSTISSGYIVWEITNIARNWLRGEANNGVILSASNENEDGRDIRFYSRERESNPPYMTVECKRESNYTTVGYSSVWCLGTSTNFYIYTTCTLLSAVLQSTVDIS